MSIFGKILAIFNVFAVVGVLALMAMNYAKRLSWEYAVFRQDLMINGLPVDKNEKDERQQPIFENISAKTQQDLFKQASPSTPVATQKDELDRVQNQLRTQYQGAGDKKKQIAELARILAPMADSSEQRQRMFSYQAHLRDDKTFAALKQRLTDADAAAKKRLTEAPPKKYEEAFHDALGAIFSDPPGPLAEAFLAVKKENAAATVEQALEKMLDTQLAQLEAQFKQMFDNAYSGGEGVKPGAPTQQKHTIARLLFNMVEVTAPAQPAQSAAAKLDLVSNPAYKRFIIVVGVKAAVEAVNEQAGILQDLAFETATERMRQRSLFAVEHGKAVDLVLDKKTELDHYKLLLARKKTEREAHLATLEQRKVDVAKYEEQLVEARKATAKHLADLRKLSADLFSERTMLLTNSTTNQELEKQIRHLEEEQ
ncbi:MAG TPA: hypothetical protein VMG10_18430 [Gemmataceae bacterium]|nr:hypothetical protein [Gemmataceae bacterium]